MVTPDRSAPADSSVASTKSLFLAAAEIDDPDRRAEFLDQACRDDATLRRQVDELLAAADSPIAKRLDRGIPADDPRTADTNPALTQGDSVPLTEGIVGVELPSERIGPYRLLQRIGEGGMGTVYMAEQTEPIRRKVALKLIKPGMDSRHVIARFEAERQALAMMDHPNIAQVLDAGTTDRGLPFFVMELVRGLPITQFCSERSLSLEETLRLFIDVCHGVQHAHQKGIIHRDLKPSNVMVTLHDGTPVVKIIDFGVAKALHQSLTERTLFTQFAQAVGTPLYMSPEQAALSGLDVDTRSDVYALGVLLFELLTGTTPVDPELARQVGMDEVRRMIRETDPPPPSRRLSTLRAGGDTTSPQALPTAPVRSHATVRGELDWITLKALEKDRGRRYQSASNLADDLQRHLEHQPVEAGPASAWYRGRKFTRRYRAAITTAATVLLALLLGITASTWQAVRATRAMHSEQQQRREADEQRREAEQQRRRAERQQALAEANFQDALAAVDRMLVQVSEEQLRDIPLIQPIRRELMGAAAEIYERFVQRHPEDNEVRLITANALIALADLHNRFHEEIDAERQLRRAIELIGPIDPDENDSAKKLELKLRAMDRLSAALVPLGDPDARFEALREGIDIARTLISVEPKAGHESVLAVLLARYAKQWIYLHKADSDFELAIELASEALDLSRSIEGLVSLATAKLLSGQLDEARALLLEAASMENHVEVQKALGRLESKAGRMDVALVHFREEFRLLSDRLRDDPGNRSVVNSWHGLTFKILGLLKSSGQKGEMQVFSNEALDFAESLLDGSLTDLLPQGMLDVLTNAQAKLYLDWMDPEAAETRVRARLESGPSDALEQVLAALLIGQQKHTELIDLFGDDPDRIENVDVLLALAQMKLQAGDNDTAISLYLRVMSLQELAIREIFDSPTKWWSSERIVPWSKAAHRVRPLLASAGRSDEYRDTVLRFISVLRELTAIPLPYRSKADLMGYLGEFYTGYHVAGVLPDEERFRWAIEAYKFVADGKGYIHKRIGWCHFHLGEYEQAIDHLRKAFKLAPKDTSALGWGGVEWVDCDSDYFVAELLKLGERFSEANSDNRDIKTKMGNLWTLAGVRLRNRDEFVEAEEFARRAADQFAAMAAGNPAFAKNSGIASRVQSGIWQTYPLLADLIAENSETAGARDDEIDAVMSQWIDIDRKSNLAISSWAEYYAKMDRWPNVIRVLDLAIATLGEEHPVFPRYWRALAELAAGDIQQYRETCRELLAADADALNDLNFVAWTCVLHPEALDDWEALLALVESLEAKATDDPMLPNTIAAVHYRAGQLDEAIGRFLQSLRLEQAGRSSPAYAAYFLAMAHQRSGRDDEARCWLDEANRWADLEWADDFDGTKPLAWNRRLTLNLLRDEATSLIDAGDVPLASRDSLP